MSKDYYNILGVSKNASQDEIKKAFRTQAHKYHPDKKGGDEAKFKEINEAHQVLGDEKKRAQYDQFGSAAFGGGGTSSSQGFGGFDFGGGGIHVNMDDLGDIFSGVGEMFGFSGGRSRPSGPSRGNDIQTTISINFRDAVFGTERELSLQKTVKCDHCKGNGAEPGTKIETCPKCNGVGQINRIQRTILGSMQTQITCPDCRGEGKVYTQKCSQCHGVGIVRDTVNIKVKIPAGIDNGETIRLSGHGEAGRQGGPAGDLYLRVQVENDPRFKRQEYDIVTQEEISFTQAALGDKIEVETINGVVKLKIPEGTQSGTIFKLRGKGIPRLRGSGQGDHLVKIIVKTPTSLSRAQKKVLRELGI